MKKFYAFAAAAVVAMTANAQALYMTGASAVGPEDGGLPENWAPKNPAEFQVVDGNFQLTVNGLQQFKVSTVKAAEDAEDAWAEFNGGALTCEYGEEAGVTVDLVEGDANIICPWEGDWTVVVSGDLKTITMTTDTPKPAGGVKLYFRGDMNGWGADEAWMFEQVSDNVYKFTCADDQKVAPGDGFKVADSSWGKYNYGGGMVYVDVDMTLDYNGENMKVDEEWNGVAWINLAVPNEETGVDEVWFVMSNDKEYVPEFATTSVKNVAVEDAPAVYYNLQGVRVANPVNGIYVKVVGKTASKVLVNNK
ncbi:MAG: hypothetical protein K2F87_04365 [Muribaculaceae bacterium]|nr:hypothetical protein [Muribaculaceae bacterium]